MLVLNNLIGEIFSNVPLSPHLKLRDSKQSTRHSFIDMGDDEFTRGIPHPMIDFTLRNQRIIQEAEEKEVGVILLDVVLGYGAHPDPAGALKEALQEARKRRGEYLCFIAHICGVKDDPQDYEKQKTLLEEEGVLLFPSNAQAARFAALVITRGTSWNRI